MRLGSRCSTRRVRVGRGLDLGGAPGARCFEPLGVGLSQCEGASRSGALLCSCHFQQPPMHRHSSGISGSCMARRSPICSRAKSESHCARDTAGCRLSPLSGRAAGVKRKSQPKRRLRSPLSSVQPTTSALHRQSGTAAGGAVCRKWPAAPKRRMIESEMKASPRMFRPTRRSEFE